MLQALGIGFIARPLAPGQRAASNGSGAPCRIASTSELRLRGIHTLEAGQRLPARVPRRLHAPLCAAARRRRPRLAPGAARSRPPLELSLLAPRRPRQHRAASARAGCRSRPALGGAPMPAVASRSASSSMGASSSSTTTPCSPVSRRPGPPSCSSRGRGLDRRAAEDGAPARSAPNARQPAPSHHRAPRARPHKALRGPIARGAALSIPPTRRPTFARPARRQPVFSHPRTPGSKPFHVANAP